LAGRSTFKTGWYDDVKERTGNGWAKIAYDGEKYTVKEYAKRRHLQLKK